METPKKFNIFQKTELFYISGNFLYLRKRLSELEKKAHSYKVPYILGIETF